MYQLVKLEIKNCINKKEFKIIFAIVFGLCILSFLAEANQKYGEYYQFIRSANESVFLQSAEGLFLLRNLNQFFPMLVSMLYAGSLIDEKRGAISGNLIMRSGKKKYIWAKAIAVFLTAFFTFFITLVCNLLLCYFVFPIEGYDSMWMEPDFFIGITSYFPECPLDFLRIQSPIIYNLLFILIYAICGGVIALFAYGMSFSFLNKEIGKLKMVFVVTFLMIVLNIIFSIIGKPEYTIQNYLITVQKGSITTLFVIWGMYLIATIIMIKRGINKYEA